MKKLLSVSLALVACNWANVEGPFIPKKPQVCVRVTVLGVSTNICEETQELLMKRKAELQKVGAIK